MDRGLRAHLSISLLSYTVAIQVQFHFRSAKMFSRTFFGAGSASPTQVAGTSFFTSLEQTKEKLFVYFFID